MIFFSYLTLSWCGKPVSWVFKTADRTYVNIDPWRTSINPCDIMSDVEITAPGNEQLSTRFIHRLTAPPAPLQVFGRVIQASVWIPRSIQCFLDLFVVTPVLTFNNNRYWVLGTLLSSAHFQKNEFDLLSRSSMKYVKTVWQSGMNNFQQLPDGCKTRIFKFSRIFFTEFV